MASRRRNEETIYVELPPFDPADEQNNNDTEDKDGIIVLSTANPFARGGGGRNTRKTRSSQGDEDEEKGSDIITLPSVDPFASRDRASRRDRTQGGDAIVVALPSVDPFARRDSTSRQNQDRSHNNTDSVVVLPSVDPFAERRRRPNEDQGDSVIVLPSVNPYAEEKSEAEDDGVVTLPSINPFETRNAGRGSSIPVRRRRGRSNPEDEQLDEDRSPADRLASVQLSETNPFSKGTDKTRSRRETEEAEDNEGEEKATVLPPVNPLRALRVSDSEEALASQIVLPSINPFARKENPSTRRQNRSSKDDNTDEAQGRATVLPSLNPLHSRIGDSDDEETSPDSLPSASPHTVLPERNPFAKDSPTADGQNVVVVELPGDFGAEADIVDLPNANPLAARVGGGRH